MLYSFISMNKIKISLLLYLISFPLLYGYSTEHKVLLVHSYHSGFLWTDSITQGIESVLDDRSDISLHIEYLDSKKQFDDKYKELIYNLIGYKFSRHNYDLIITADNNAFELIQSFKKTLFPTTPILFCGLNNIKKEDTTDFTNVSGVYEIADIEGNIELIYQLQPDIEKIVIITDNTVTGSTVVIDVVEIMLTHPEWELEFVNDISMEELLVKLRSLNSRTAVLLTFFFRDNNEKFYEYDVGTPLITSNTSSPVYTLWDFNLNLGVVGGLVVDGKKHGMLVAKQVLQVLDGTRIEDIPIEYETPTSLILDYNSVSEYKLKTRGIEDIKYINKPERVWVQYREHIILMLIILGLLTVTIYALTHSLIISRRSKREYLSLVNNIPGITYRSLMDECYKMLIVGRGIEEITGYTSEEFLNGSISLGLLILGDDRDKIRETINQAVNKRESYTLEYQIKDRSGHLHWIQERGRGVFSDLGNLLYLDGLILDITHQKNVEEDLNHYRKHLEELVEERTKNLADAQEHIIESSKMSSLALLVAGVAHEINTPAGICLTSTSYLQDEIQSLIKSLENDDRSDEFILSTLEKFLKTINLSMNNLNRINSLIDNFKQMSVDQNDENPRYFNITQYFQKLFDELYSGERYKDLTIELHASQKLTIYSHPGVLTQVFTYLIKNSLDHAFTDSSIHDQRITISIEEIDDHMHITYSDNGIGIPKENITKIFEPFFTTSRNQGHHGLGLNIVYNLILKKLDGTIKYIPDKTAFLITFKTLD